MKKIFITSYLFIMLLFLTLSVPRAYAATINSLNESTSQNNINTNSTLNTTNLVSNTLTNNSNVASSSSVNITSNTSTNIANTISSNSVNTVSKKTNTEQQNTTSTATTQNISSDSFGLRNTILSALLCGFIVATFFCIIVWLKHKPVHVAKNANQYLDTSTINITKSYDHYVSSNTEKKALYKNN